MMRPTNALAQEVGLHLMINQLSASTMPIATRKSSFIVNDIPAELSVKADPQKLAAVLGTLLHTMISQSNNSCIRISAKTYGNVMLVHIRNDRHHSGQAFASSLEEAQQIAQKLGGTVTVNNYRDGATTITFSFLIDQFN
jgi:signal transduction histidine kinase